MASSLLVAGCSNPFESDEVRLDWHAIHAYNYDDQPRTFDVTVRNDADEAIFERVYDFGANEADEDGVIKGDPASATVVIDDTYTKEFEWAPETTLSPDTNGAYCHSRASVGLKIEVLGSYLTEGEFDGNSPDNAFQRSFFCQTVTANE